MSTLETDRDVFAESVSFSDDSMTVNFDDVTCPFHSTSLVSPITNWNKTRT